MKATEVINSLMELIKEHGDCECEFADYYEYLSVDEIEAHTFRRELTKFRMK
jgi:hypothetical protein